MTIRAFGVKVLIMVLSLVYAILKLFPVNKNKVLFLSRQSSTMPLDFRLLKEEFERREEPYELVFICARVEKGFLAKCSWAKCLFRSMYHLATTTACVLDAAWPAVAVFKHKPCLTVVQIWHALGKIKQSGLQSVDKPGGHSSEFVKVMHMHEGYDYCIAGAPVWNRFYAECFPISVDQVVNLGLPRLDLLTSDAKKERMARRIYEVYPEMQGKRVVLYAPTFRRVGDYDYTGFMKLFDPERYFVIFKGHPIRPIESFGAHTCKEFTTMQLLSVADLLITDYSATAVEAAAANVRTLYFLYDYDLYKETTGFNLDLPQVVPELIHYDDASLFAAVEAAFDGDYPEAVFKRYQETYVLKDTGHSTKDIVDFVISHMG